jgi:hypothetical protein
MLVDFFHNIVDTYLFIICACKFTYFSVLIKLLNNKTSMQQGARWLPVGPLAPVFLT